MSAVAKMEAKPVATTPERSPSPIMDLVSHAVQNGQPIEVIRELMAMSKELAADEARRAFDEAVSAAKAEIKPIVRRSQGHNGKYADLATIADEIDPIISRYGLSYRHRLSQTEKSLTVACLLSHKAGHREETSLTAAHDTSGNKNPIQAIGSTQQYLMRYTLLAALGLSTAKDDDGRAAGKESGTVTDAQVTELRSLIEQTDTDIAKFCEAFKIDALPDLPAAAYEAATKSMYIKLARKLSEAKDA